MTLPLPIPTISLHVAVAALMTLGCVASLAQGQAPQPETQTLSPIRVEDTETADVVYKAKNGSAGTKTDTPLLETPQSISVITAEQIRDQNATNMQEVLRYTAGVRAEMYGLDNRGDWFDLRGGSEGSTLLDGLRVPLSGYYGVVRSEPFAFDRVEVLRGPSSVVAGQNGPGGVINLVSKLPQAEAASEISVQLGNFNQRQLGIDLTGPVNDGDTVWYRFVALGRQADTQVKYADEERVYVAPSLTWHPEDGVTLTAYAQYQKDESRNTEGFFPWAGTLLPAPNGPIDEEVFVGEPDWDVYGGERIRAGYRFEYVLNDAWTLRHQLRYDRIEGKMYSMYANFWEVDAAGAGYGSNALGDNRTIGRSWYLTDNFSRITNGEFLAEGHLDAGDTDHTLLLGIDGMRLTDGQAELGGTATPLDVYAPVYGTFPLPALDFGAPAVTRARQIGVFAQDQMKFNDRWVVVASLRRDQARTGIDGDPPEAGADSFAVTRRLGLVYVSPSGWAPYASYSESFELVTGTDRLDNAFKPKRGEQIEAGIKWSPGAQRFIATASAYKLKETNRLAADPVDPNFNVQRGEVTVEGVELDVTAALGSWDFVGNYTYTDAVVSTATDPADPSLDKQLPSIPEHSAAMWATYRFDLLGIPGFRAGAGVRYVGETSDGLESLFTPSNTLFDAMLSFEQGNWRYSLNGSNLADKIYFATCLDRGDCWYGTRREISATASYRW